jgi:lipid A 4'-phosphatase
MSLNLRKRVDLIAFCLALVVFICLPRLDLAVSDLLHTPQEGFVFRNNAWVLAVDGSVRYIVIALLLALVSLLAIGFMQQAEAIRRLRRGIVYLFIVLLAGPGLVVNSLLKDHWGRARPDQVVEYGGTLQYTPPFLPANECGRNCSFVSGHAAVPFYFVAFGFLFPRQRRAWIFASIAAGAVVGLSRMLQGDHFVSDIVFSFFAVYFVAKWAHRFMFSPATGSVNHRPTG